MTLRRLVRALWRVVTDGDAVVGALVVALFALYAATRGVFQGKASGDGLSTLLYLPSVFVHHTLDIRQAVAEARAFVLPVVNGHMINRYPVGPSILWAPFYLVGLAVESIGRALGAWRHEPFGVNYVSYWFCGLGTLVYAVVAIGCMFRFLRRRFDVAAARFGTVAAILATPMAWYLLHQPTYQHGLSFAFAVFVVERWDVWRAGPTWRRHVAVGALVGVAALVRTQELIFLALPGLDVAATMLAAARARDGRRAVDAAAKGLATLAVALAVFGVQVLVWHYYLGGWKTSASWDWMRWRQPEIVGVLFSTRAGLFAWSPILYLALFGFVAARRRLGLVEIALLVIFAADTYVNSVKSDWWGQWSFGARRFCDVTIVFALGLAAAWEGVPRVGWRRFWAAAAALLVVFNLVAMEYVRRLRTNSSGGFAESAWARLRSLGAPEPLWRTLRTVGWPPSWPASIPFALRWHVPVYKFEEVYGNYFLVKLYRDEPRIQRGFDLADADMTRRYVVEGIAAGGVVDGPVRMFVPVFEAIPIELLVEGVFAPGEIAMTWNGAPVGVDRMPNGIALHVRARYGVNDLRMTLPAGSRVSRFHVDDGQLF